MLKPPFSNQFKEREKNHTVISIAMPPTPRLNLNTKLHGNLNNSGDLFLRFGIRDGSRRDRSIEVIWPHMFELVKWSSWKSVKFRVVIQGGFDTVY